jgi:hypothetical protein
MCKRIRRESNAPNNAQASPGYSHPEQNMKTKSKILMATLVALVVAGSALAGNGNQGNNDNDHRGNLRNPGVLPPHAEFDGLTYSEWEAEWWKAALALPVTKKGYHPLFTGGVFGEHKGILFLTGVGGGATVNITIPAETALFFPIVNAECSEIEGDPFHGDDEEEMRECANAFIDSATGLAATIDGKAVKNLGAYRVESPLFEFGPLPKRNAFGLPAGATSLSVDAGYYLLLDPLSVGTHTIHFEGTIEDLDFTVDTTYVITVVPKK